MKGWAQAIATAAETNTTVSCCRWTSPRTPRAWEHGRCGRERGRSLRPRWRLPGSRREPRLLSSKRPTMKECPVTNRGGMSRLLKFPKKKPSRPRAGSTKKRARRNDCFSSEFSGNPKKQGKSLAWTQEKERGQGGNNHGDGPNGNTRSTSS